MKKKFILSLLLSAILTTAIAPNAMAQIKKTYSHKRIYGSTRIETAVEIAKEFNKDSCDNVILATSDNFPDALSGSVLASKLKAPILLVNKTVEDSNDVMTYIKEHINKKGKVYILGGVGAVSDDFVKYLQGNGYNNVVRLGGSNRIDTSNLISREIDVPKGTPVVLVTADNFPDALSISSIAALNQYPIILTSKDHLEYSTKDVIAKISPSKLYIIGGEGAVSNEALREAVAFSGIKENGGVVRIAGDDRYETSVKVAKAFNLDTTNAVIATGENFPDALSGSVLASKLKAPIILSNNYDINLQKRYIDNSNINNIYFLGGEGALNNDTLNKIIAPYDDTIRVTYDEKLTNELWGYVIQHTSYYKGIKKAELDNIARQVATNQLNEKEAIELISKMSWRENPKNINKYFQGGDNSKIEILSVRCSKFTVDGNKSAFEITQNNKFNLDSYGTVLAYRNPDNSITITSMACNFAVFKN